MWQLNSIHGVQDDDIPDVMMVFVETSEQKEQDADSDDDNDEDDDCDDSMPDVLMVEYLWKPARSRGAE